MDPHPAHNAAGISVRSYHPARRAHLSALPRARVSAAVSADREPQLVMIQRLFRRFGSVRTPAGTMGALHAPVHVHLDPGTNDGDAR